MLEELSSSLHNVKCNLHIPSRGVVSSTHSCPAGFMYVHTRTTIQLPRVIGELSCSAIVCSADVHVHVSFMAKV